MGVGHKRRQNFSKGLAHSISLSAQGFLHGSRFCRRHRLRGLGSIRPVLKKYAYRYHYTGTYQKKKKEEQKDKFQRGSGVHSIKLFSKACYHGMSSPHGHGHVALVAFQYYEPFCRQIKSSHAYNHVGNCNALAHYGARSYLGLDVSNHSVRRSRVHSSHAETRPSL